MAALHSALQSLGPCIFRDIPSSPLQLETYLQDLFKQSQLILDSVPIPPPEGHLETRPRSLTVSSAASNASEISSSSARSAPPIPEAAALQKEWGKPIKLAAKDNLLNMAVYKMSGKDGRGAWFARRSVHEGLAFAKFKKSLEMEFPESLAVQGAPGEGNIRGIGGDRRVENIAVPGNSRLEVFQLSAQFPGPTTPRDFVTLLITSSNAIKYNDECGRPDLSPRHYMIISKPCDHPETQPRNGYVRGNYESIEFIREVPRRPTKTKSSLDLSRLAAGKGSPVEKEALLRSAEKKKTNALTTSHESRSTSELNAATDGSKLPGRRRGITISFPESRADNLRTVDDEYDAELNPVEWIMVTRSDPGGSVPRFMVERGTPGGIVADASKFLDWACQNLNVDDDFKSDSKVDFGNHRDSYASYELNGHLAGINGDSFKEVNTIADERPSSAPSTPPPQPIHQPGVLSSITGALSAGLEAYAPQAVVDRLPGHVTPASGATTTGASTTLMDQADHNDLGEDETDTESISNTSFASADSHFDLSSDDHTSPSLSTSITQSSVAVPKKASQEKRHLTSHEKELAKLSARRAALDAKLESTRNKSQKEHQTLTAKERDALRKAEEKHQKEVSKQEEKYRKGVEKLEERARREKRKMEERWRKEREKEEKRAKDKEKQEEEEKGKEEDEKKRLVRERDEARKEGERLKAERERWKAQIGDLQMENTRLVARIGRLESLIQGGSLSEKASSESTVGADVGAGTREGGNDKAKEKMVQTMIMDKDAVKNLLREEGVLGSSGNPNPSAMAAVKSALADGNASGSERASVISVDGARSRSSSWLKRQMSGLGVGVAGLGPGLGTEKAGGGSGKHD